jgi:hypothetical protein
MMIFIYLFIFWLFYQFLYVNLLDLLQWTYPTHHHTSKNVLGKTKGVCFENFALDSVFSLDFICIVCF